MKIIVIGLGSMGRRRIRLLKNNFKDIKLLGIDLNQQRCEYVRREFNLKTYNSVDKIKQNNFDAAFICTSPIHHSKLINKCLDENLHVFSEINLVSNDYEKISNKANKKNLKIFLSSTMLYREEINYIKEKINDQDCKFNYRYHVGQYLPDWHPWESYKDFFVSNKKTNGCRELFAVELPWIIKLFGKISSLKVFKGKISNLEINYPDSYSVMLNHESGDIGTLNVDIVSRKPIRDLEIFSSNLHLFWDGTPEGLKLYDIKEGKIKYINTYRSVKQNKNYASNIIENAYLEEIKVFIDKIKGNNREKYTFEDDIYTLSIIDKIEGDFQI